MVKNKRTNGYLLLLAVLFVYFTLYPRFSFAQFTIGSEDIGNINIADVVIDENCPPGTLYTPQMGSCVEVRDMRSNFQPTVPEVAGRRVPNLADIRMLRSPKGLPIPSGIGAGTTYKQGRIKAITRGQLYTDMFVYPNGIGNLSNWIFTTATNRTEKTIEVVGIYFGSGPGSFGIFDWSCMPGYPCPNGNTTASWQWTRPLSNSCYYTMKDDSGGHQHNLMNYQNLSIKLDNGNPPLWRNYAAIWNYCTSTWDLCYSHDFRVNQKDCSSIPTGDPNACGWWGPIIETFIEGTQPQIKELGFWWSLLFHDGEWSFLRTDDTDWVSPAQHPPWQEFHRDPNRSWGAGNFTNN